MFHSLRTRLIVINLGLIILGFGTLTLWAGRQMARATWDDYGNTQRILTIQLANQLVEPLEDNSAQVQTISARSAENLNANITVYNQANTPLFSSHQPVPQTSINTPYTLQNGLVSSSAEIIYEGQTLGTVQLATSSNIPQAAIQQRWLALGGAFLAFSAIGALITAWLLGSFLRPLARLRESALQIASGDLDHRATDLPPNEIGAVGTAFNSMTDRVAALIDEQRAFASNASHELRTPLTTIRLRTEALQTELEPAIQTQYIAEIDSEAKRLSQLVDDLMLLSRIDAKRLEGGSEQLDLVRLIQWAARQYQAQASAKNIDLRYVAPENAMQITATTTHIQMVLRNIVDNAIKYTPEKGSVQIRLEQDGVMGVVTVEDTGVGISAENLPNIGKRFYRTDKARNRAVAGTGLGLALVRSIADLYGGKLTIQSDGVGEGTTVILLWPLNSSS